jgi:hypothetical protein
MPLSLFAQNLFESKVASIFVSEEFINEQLSAHLTKSNLVRNLKIKLDPVSKKMFLHGIFQRPLDDIRAIGIERSLADFKFSFRFFQRSVLRSILFSNFLFLKLFSTRPIQRILKGIA